MNDRIEAVTAPDFKGCLVCNSMVEFGRDVEVTAITARHNGAIEESFHPALQRALDDGELHAKTDIRALAQFLANLGHGIALQGRGGVTREKAAAICIVAERLLSDAVRDA